MKIAIQSIFESIECDEKLMSEMLADTTVTDNNMMQFLGVIEQVRLNALLCCGGEGHSCAVALALACWHCGLTRRVCVRSLQRTNEILQKYAALSTLQSTGEGRSVSPQRALVSLFGQGPSTQHGSEGITLELPKLDDYDSVRAIHPHSVAQRLICALQDEGNSDDENTAQPLSIEELKARTRRRIEKHSSRPTSSLSQRDS